jgi:hypothetical protein
MKNIILLLAFSCLLLSCKTYTVPPESFKRQWLESDGNKLREVSLNQSYNRTIANSLKYLSVYDKQGMVAFIQNSPSIEMLVTLKNGKQKLFYLDTVTLEDDTLKGIKSRILGLPNKVAFADIAKIEVQDGGKNYHYVDPPLDVTILEHSHKIYEQRGEVLEHHQFKIDTVAVKYDKYTNFYYALCKFDHSGTELGLVYYINENALEMVTVRERSPLEQEVTWINQFFIENNGIFTKNSYPLANKEGEVPLKKHYSDYQFNRSVDASFQKKFLFELYTKLTSGVTE